MIENPDFHKFNDDLFLDPADQAKAAIRFPTIAHVLIDPQLHGRFAQHDRSANDAKRLGRRLGLASILAVLIALMLAAVEPYLPHETSHSSWLFEHMHKIVALVSGAFGLGGAIVGSFGVLHAARKRRWLLDRLATERLRQLHFQAFVCRLDEIDASLVNSEAIEKYQGVRRTWFSDYEARFEGKLDSEFERARRNRAGQKLNSDEAPTPVAFSSDIPGWICSDMLCLHET